MVKWLSVIGYRLLVIMAVIFGLPLFCAAQKPAELKKLGEKFFDNKNYKAAADKFAAFQQVKPGDESVMTKLGISFLETGDADGATRYLEYVLRENPETKDPELYLNLARLMHGKSDFSRAITFYKFYLRVAGKEHKMRAFAVDNIKRCVQALGIKGSENLALIENLGDHVNTSDDEFGPLPSVNHANRLYFSSARAENILDVRDDEGLLDSIKGKPRADMFYANRTKTGWEFPMHLAGLLNTAREEMVLDFNENGKILYYFRGNTLFGGDIFADTAQVTDEYAAAPKPVYLPMNARAGDNFPYFFNDSTLLFSSRREGGFGGHDLYISFLKNSIWQTPENLGASINTAYDEITPFLANDGQTLYFSSNHNATLGGHDAFKSIFNDLKKTWNAPQNLGAGINSPHDDLHFRLSNDGKNASFSSNRFGGFGGKDLYFAYFKTEVAEQLKAAGLFSFSGKNIGPIETESPDNQSVNTLSLDVLHYNDEQDIVSAHNQKTLDIIAENYAANPQLKVLMTVHTDETAASKFDLFYGIKRAEVLGKALTERKIPAANIILRSVGYEYPIAKMVLGKDDNPIGAKLNRRVEMTFTSLDKLPFKVELKKPAVSEIMAVEGAEVLEVLTAGLSFRVKMADTRQIYTNDAIAMFTDVMIESQPATGSYRYTAGLYKEFKEAEAMRIELLGQDFGDAAVLAYINGVQITKNEAAKLVKKYPGLADFVKGK